MTELSGIPRVGATQVERPAAQTSKSIQTQGLSLATVGTSAPSAAPEDELFAMRRPAGAHAEAITVEEARQWLARGGPERALAALDGVWHDDIAGELPWVVRAAALELLGRSGDAIALLSKKSGGLPRSTALLYLGALAQLSEGNPSVAADLLGRALTIRPGDPLLLGLSAIVVAREGRHAEARSAIDEVLAHDGAHPALGTMRKVILASFDVRLLSAGAFGERNLLVHALVTPALSLVADNPVLDAKGGGRPAIGDETGPPRWELVGRSGEAIALLARASESLPRSTALLYLGALAQLAEGKPAIAADLLGRALTIHPGDPLLLGLSALVASREGRHSEARSEIDEALAHDGAHPALGTMREAILAVADGRLNAAGSFGERNLLLHVLVTPAPSLVVDHPLRGASAEGRPVATGGPGPPRWVEPAPGWAWWGAAWHTIFARRMPPIGGARLFPVLLAVAGAVVALRLVPNRTTAGWLLAIAVGILASTAIRVGMRRRAPGRNAQDLPHP